MFLEIKGTLALPTLETFVKSERALKRKQNKRGPAAVESYFDLETIEENEDGPHPPSADSIVDRGEGTGLDISVKKKSKKSKQDVLNDAPSKWIDFIKEINNEANGFNRNGLLTRLKAIHAILTNNLVSLGKIKPQEDEKNLVALFKLANKTEEESGSLKLYVGCLLGIKLDEDKDNKKKTDEIVQLVKEELRVGGNSTDAANFCINTYALVRLLDKWVLLYPTVFTVSFLSKQSPQNMHYYAERFKHVPMQVSPSVNAECLRYYIMIEKDIRTISNIFGKDE